MFTPSTHFMNFYIAGFTFANGIDVIDDLKLGVNVQLVGETDNPHDPHAVAIYFEKTHIGYIPADQNEDIWNFIFFGHGDMFDAKISSVFPDKHPEKQFMVTIRIKDNRKK